MNTLSMFTFRLLAAIVASLATIGFYMPIASAAEKNEGPIGNVWDLCFKSPGALCTGWTCDVGSSSFCCNDPADRPEDCTFIGTSTVKGKRPSGSDGKPAPKRSPLPYSGATITAPILQRGVEPESPPSAPTAPTGEEDKAPAPK
jgi:hypothetical protein